MLASLPRKPSGIVWFHIVMRKIPLIASAAAGDRQTRERRPQRAGTNRRPTIATPHDRRGHHHREAVTMDARRPAAGQARDERAARRRGVEQPEDRRPAEPVGDARETAPAACRTPSRRSPRRRCRSAPAGCARSGTPRAPPRGSAALRLPPAGPARISQSTAATRAYETTSTR